MENEEEIWVPIKSKGFEKTHLVSNLGRIKSLVPTNKRKIAPFIVSTGVINGILTARIYNKDHERIVCVANEVLTAFGAERVPGYSIVYYDENKMNCRFSNLRFGSRSNKVEVVNTSGRSCKKCAFYKCFQNQDDGIHFKIDYALEGCFKYVEKEI